jgi:GNAT superfamily N-acetyltransferase
MAIRIRPAEVGDVPTLAAFAVALAHVHLELDTRRFVVPAGGLSAFVEFFTRELDRPETVLLIAEDDAIPIGYAFVRIEPASMEALCEPSAWLHDIYVDPASRGSGAGRRLLASAIESAGHLGASSFMLAVSPANSPARRLFERFGLRPTMIEMRLELETSRLNGGEAQREA